MGSCTFRKFQKERLCVSDLNKIATIISREVVGDDIFSQNQNVTKETQIGQAWCSLSNNLMKNLKSDVRHNGINIGNDATHKISFRFDDVSSIVFDQSKISIEIDLIRYRIVSSSNFNEQNEIVDCYCVVRGDVGSNEVQT